MIEDRFRFEKRLKHCRANDKEKLTSLNLDIQASISRFNLRQTNLPEINFPDNLPISQRADELIEAIKRHQVLIVCGETGSGKSTQLPKICLKAGRGISGMIGVTQPRRLAVKSVSARVSEELDSTIGDAVGFRVRHHESIDDKNYIRVLTDGMLLAECSNDRFLNRYDTIIIDEAHERSLNIDFLIGLVKVIVAKRKELKIIITSATLDAEKLSRHFGEAPIFSISGRTYPVEIRYRELSESDKRNDDTMYRGIGDAINELQHASPGDVLVFLPGEREIRETAKFLSKFLKPGIDVVPLYARLTPTEQYRIFHPGGKTRVVLSTNVAETSLTVPGIRYVVDSGLVRTSRYSTSRKIKRLPVERISRASADQRKGRCGRTSDGICIRLYSENDYELSQEFTDPEIIRTSLSEVILKLESMKVGHIEDFPFIDPPDRKQITDGVHQLQELGALDVNRNITAIGRQLSALSVDPRIGRMLLAASELKCLNEVILVAAALSIADPRVVPADKIQAARQQHKQLSKESSDFMVFIDIWKQFDLIRRKESKRQAWKWCDSQFLSAYRMREWLSLQASLKRELKRLQLKFNTEPASEEQVHRALLHGLIGNIAQLTEKERSSPKNHLRGKKQVKLSPTYTGTFGKSLTIFPASHMRGNTAKWIMCAEMIDTHQLYANSVAPIQIHWIETVAKPLLKYAYSEPHWDIKQERVSAFQKATLYGLTIFSRRRCDYSRINPQESRAIFIRSALVDRELSSRLPFYRHNCTLLDEIETLENRIRRRDLLVEDDFLISFYSQKLPDWINTASGLRKWHKSLSDDQKRELYLTRDQVMMRESEQYYETEYPLHFQESGIDLNLKYTFEPGQSDDGVTAVIELALLNQLSAEKMERLVPGLLEEKVLAMVRNLPKNKRKQFVPIPDTVQQIMEEISQDSQPLKSAIACALNRYKQTDVVADDLDGTKLMPHLVMKYELINNEGEVVALSDDLDALQSRYSDQAHASFVSKSPTSIERAGLVDWDFEQLPEKIEISIDDNQLMGYPALVDEETSVSIKVYDDQDTAESMHREGVRRLISMRLPQHDKLIKSSHADWQTASLLYSATGLAQELRSHLYKQAQDQVYFSSGRLVRSRDEFEKLIQSNSVEFGPTLANLLSSSVETLQLHRHVCQTLDSNLSKLPTETVDDINSQLEWLVYDGYVAETASDWILQLPRYLNGIVVRLEKAIRDGATDRQKLWQLKDYWTRYIDSEWYDFEELIQYRWMIEEYRLSIFSQPIKTRMPVSEKRLNRQWDRVLKITL